MNRMDCDFNTISAKDLRVGDVNLTSTIYKNIYLGVSQLQTTAVASYALANVSTAAATVGNLAIFLDDTASEIAGFSFTLPKDYKPGSSMLPYINYSCTSATGSTGAIAFGLAWSEINATPTTALVNLTNQEIATMGSTGALSIITTYFAAIGTTSLKAGSVISGCVYRNTTKAASTYCDLDAVVYGIGFLYQMDGIGSTYNTVFGK